MAIDDKTEHIRFS